MPFKSPATVAIRPTTLTEASRSQDAAVIAAAEQWARSLERLHHAERRTGSTAAEEEALVVAVTELYDAICARQTGAAETPSPLLSFVEPLGNA